VDTGHYCRIHVFDNIDVFERVGYGRDKGNFVEVVADKVLQVWDRVKISRNCSIESPGFLFGH